MIRKKRLFLYIILASFLLNCLASQLNSYKPEIHSDLYNGPLNGYLSYNDVVAFLKQDGQLVIDEDIVQIYRLNFANGAYAGKIFKDSISFMKFNPGKKEYNPQIYSIQFGEAIRRVGWGQVFQTTVKGCSLFVAAKLENSVKVPAPQGSVYYEWTCNRLAKKRQIIWSELLFENGEVYQYTTDLKLFQPTKDKCWSCNPSLVPEEFKEFHPLIYYIYNGVRNN